MSAGLLKRAERALRDFDEVYTFVIGGAKREQPHDLGTTDRAPWAHCRRCHHSAAYIERDPALRYCRAEVTVRLVGADDDA